MSLSRVDLPMPLGPTCEGVHGLVRGPQGGVRGRAGHPRGLWAGPGRTSATRLSMSSPSSTCWKSAGLPG